MATPYQGIPPNQLELEHGAPVRPNVAGQNPPPLVEGQRVPHFVDLSGNSRVTLPAPTTSVGTNPIPLPIVRSTELRLLAEMQALEEQAIALGAPFDPHRGIDYRFR